MRAMQRADEVSQSLVVCGPRTGALRCGRKLQSVVGDGVSPVNLRYRIQDAKSFFTLRVATSRIDTKIEHIREFVQIMKVIFAQACFDTSIL